MVRRKRTNSDRKECQRGIIYYFRDFETPWSDTGANKRVVVTLQYVIRDKLIKTCTNTKYGAAHVVWRRNKSIHKRWAIWHLTEILRCLFLQINKYFINTGGDMNRGCLFRICIRPCSKNFNRNYWIHKILIQKHGPSGCGKR